MQTYTTNLPQYPVSEPAYGHYIALFIDYLKGLPAEKLADLKAPIPCTEYLCTDKASKYLLAIDINMNVDVLADAEIVYQSCEVVLHIGKFYLKTFSLLQYVSGRQLSKGKNIITSHTPKIALGDIIARNLSNIPVLNTNIKSFHTDIFKVVSIDNMGEEKNKNHQCSVLLRIGDIAVLKI